MQLTAIVFATAFAFPALQSAPTAALPAQERTEVRQSTPGWLGVMLQDAAGGVAASGVEANSPAANAGLSNGDKIIAVDGQSVEHSSDVVAKVRGAGAGSTITLRIEREVQSGVELADNNGSKRPRIGVTLEELGGEGVRASSVESGSPAEQAGLRAGDRILAVDGQAIQNSDALRKIVAGANADQKLTLRIGRELSATLSAANDGEKRALGGAAAPAWPATPRATLPPAAPELPRKTTRNGALAVPRAAKPLAQESAPNGELRDALRDLRAELASLRADLAALRKEIHAMRADNRNPGGGR